MSTVLLFTSLATRVFVGMFFAIAGFHKLTRKRSYIGMFKMLYACHIPHARLMTPVISVIELLAGLGVACGFLTPLSALGLIGVSIVATCTNGRRVVRSHWRRDNDIGDAFNAYAYMPEVLYALMLAPYLINGAGALSLDALLLRVF